MIRSDRLELIPFSVEFLRASLMGDVPTAARVLELSLPGDWPDCRDVLELRLSQLEADPSLEPWLMRAMRLLGTGEMVGHIGFHSAPGAAYLQEFAPRGVEFGFEVFPPFRRRGFALEASRALMDWARQVHDVKEFVLSIRPDNLPSQALAAQLGFARVGSHFDEVDGLEDVLVLLSPPRKAPA